jgi:hypothetical protein
MQCIALVVIAILISFECRFCSTSRRTDATSAAVPAATPSFAADFDSFSSAATDNTTAISTDVKAASPTVTTTITTPATFDTSAWLSFDKPLNDTAVTTSFANFDTDASSSITATTDAAAAGTSVPDATASIQSKQSDDDKSNDNIDEKQEPITPPAAAAAAAAADSTNDAPAATANNTVLNDDNAALASEPEVAVVADTDTVHDNTAGTDDDSAAATTLTVTAASAATTTDYDSITVASVTTAKTSDDTTVNASESTVQQSQQHNTEVAAEQIASTDADTASDAPDTTTATQHSASTATSDLAAAATTAASAELPVTRISVLAKLSPAVTLAEVLANDTLSPVLSNNPRYVCISHIRHHTGESTSTTQTSSSTSGSTTVSALEVFDLLKGQCNRYPITAAAAIMRPAVSDSEPRVIALYVKQDSSTNSSGRFNVFNMDSGARLRDQPMAAPLLLWRWLNSSVLVLVTHASVFHWDTSGHSRPVKAFDRQYTLPNAIATAASNNDTAVATAAAARSRSASVSANSVCLKGYCCSDNSTVTTSDWALLLAVPAQHAVTSSSSSHESSLTVDLHDFKRSVTYKLRVLGACFSSVDSSNSNSSGAATDDTSTIAVLAVVTADANDASKHVLKVLDLSKPPTAGSIDTNTNMCPGWCVLADYKLHIGSHSGNYILLPLITAAAAAAVVLVSRNGHVSVVSITTEQGNSTVQCIERLSVQACNGMIVIDASISSDSKHVVIATAATETQTCRVLKLSLHDILQCTYA